MHVLTAVGLASALLAFAQHTSNIPAGAHDTNPITQGTHSSAISEQPTLTSSDVQILKDAIVKALAGWQLAEEAPTKTAVVGGVARGAVPGR